MATISSCASTAGPRASRWCASVPTSRARASARSASSSSCENTAGAAWARAPRARCSRASPADGRWRCSRGTPRSASGAASSDAWPSAASARVGATTAISHSSCGTSTPRVRPRARGLSAARPGGDARMTGEPPCVDGHAAAARHRRHALDGLEGANQHAAGPARGVGDRVQTVVDAVVEVDVGVAARAVEQRAAAGTERGVRGFVLGPEVRLHLDDAPGRRRAAVSRDDDAAEEVARDGGRGTEVERAGERPRRGRAAAPRGARASRSRTRWPPGSAAPPPS